MPHPATANRAPPAARDASRALAAYGQARAAAFELFARSSRIQPLWRALTEATDGLLKSVAPAPVAVIAVGGYGRRELFPYSDVDVLLLVPEAAPQASAALVPMLQQLWDMGIPVSHAVRTIEETIAAAKADHSIATALLDARLVIGDRSAYLALKKRLKRDVFGADKRGFIAAKLADRDQRHRKWGDSRFVLEPNLKEGKGGLRDLHTLNWLARYGYGLPKASALVRADLLTQAEWQHYRHAYLFFSTVRAHLHLLRGRADERLTFDMQARIAEVLRFRGKTSEEKAGRLMLRYFQFTRQVGSLTRIFCSILEEENLRTVVPSYTAEALARQLPEGFTLDGGRLNFSAVPVLTEAPERAVELFALAQKQQLAIHPLAYLAINRQLPGYGRKLPIHTQANRLLLQILLGRAPDQTLRRMNECGLLGALLPEFNRIVGMMQYDGYHTYTVDEHTLVAIGNLAAIEEGEWREQFPLASALVGEVTDRAALYLAMLGHDLAKGTGGGHAEKGAAMTAVLAARLGLSPATGELAGWLVANHLIFSDTAFRRDLDDPQTIADFAARVQSPERLRMLLLVTVADIKAVGPAIWNGWKGALMRDLHRRALAQMGVGREHLPEAEQAQSLLAALPLKWQSAAAPFFAQRLPSGWWQREREEQVASLAAYAAWSQLPKETAIRTRHDAFRAVSEITCCLSYRPGVFRTLAGAMALSGASIVSARSTVLTDGAAIFSFGVQDIHGRSFAEEEKRLAALPDMVARALAGELRIDRELPRRRVLTRGRTVAVEPSVFIDNRVSAGASVIEVNARDRLGLLYDILGAMEACELQVMTAHIATYGTKAVDVFYVKNAYGHKIEHRAKQAQVSRALIAAVGPTRDAA